MPFHINTVYADGNYAYKGRITESIVVTGKKNAQRIECKHLPLAEKAVIRIDDLYGIPLICSEQSAKADLPRWCGEKLDKLHIAGTGSLFFNGAVFVQEGLGPMLTFNKLADTCENSVLCFRPLEPALETWMYVIWKKYQVFTPIAERLLQRL